MEVMASSLYIIEGLIYVSYEIKRRFGKSNVRLSTPSLVAFAVLRKRADPNLCGTSSQAAPESLMYEADSSVDIVVQRNPQHHISVHSLSMVMLITMNMTETSAKSTLAHSTSSPPPS